MVEEDPFAWATEEAERISLELLFYVVERDLNPLIAAAACAMLAGDLCRMLAAKEKTDAGDAGLAAARLLLSRTSLPHAPVDTTVPPPY
jgi:hypothetical protein